MTTPVQTTLPSGTYTGALLCRPRGSARFYQCPICGGWVDGDDTHKVMEHEGGTTPAKPLVAQAS